MTPSDPADLLAPKLWAAFSHLQRQMRSGLPPAGLGAAPLAALARIHRSPGLTPSLLAEATGVRLQTLTRLLNALETQGCIRRNPHPSDGRQSLLKLAPAGLRALKGEARRREALLARAIETTLDRREQAQLLAACALLERLGEAMSTSPGAAGTPTKREAG